MSEYADLINSSYDLAEIIGLDQAQNSWIIVNHVWWPNPHYTGEPVAHPECNWVFHPEKLK